MDFMLPDLFVRGGWCMYPIFLCSVIAVGFFIERLFRLRRAKVLPRELMQNVNDLISRRKYNDAVFLCQGHPSAMARIYHAALKASGQPRHAIKEVVQEVGRHEASDLTRYISILSTVASVSPLLGLLGTVSGMIKIFNVLSYYGAGNPGTLAAGISEALITTFAGLTVAIPTIIGYRFISSKADGLISEMEEYSIILVEALKGQEP
ncbi:MAG: MotA/TolQ/ExbB proton channel family protein [Thermodesulfobacteriota bacterium]